MPNLFGSDSCEPNPLFDLLPMRRRHLITAKAVMKDQAKRLTGVGIPADIQTAPQQ